MGEKKKSLLAFDLKVILLSDLWRDNPEWSCHIWSGQKRLSWPSLFHSEIKSREETVQSRALPSKELRLRLCCGKTLFWLLSSPSNSKNCDLHNHTYNECFKRQLQHCCSPTRLIFLIAIPLACRLMGLNLSGCEEGIVELIVSEIFSHKNTFRDTMVFTSKIGLFFFLLHNLRVAI